MSLISHGPSKNLGFSSHKSRLFLLADILSGEAVCNRT